MILVDSSVWIDFFNQAQTPECLQLVRWLEAGDVSVGTADLVVFEVLRGFRNDKACLAAQKLMLELPVMDIGGAANALSAAALYRRLRAQGRNEPLFESLSHPLHPAGSLPRVGHAPPA